MITFMPTKSLGQGFSCSYCFRFFASNFKRNVPKFSNLVPGQLIQHGQFSLFSFFGKNEEADGASGYVTDMVSPGEYLFLDLRLEFSKQISVEIGNFPLLYFINYFALQIMMIFLVSLLILSYLISIPRRKNHLNQNISSGAEIVN